jgi:hypothetical protein
MIHSAALRLLLAGPGRLLARCAAGPRALGGRRDDHAPRREVEEIVTPNKCHSCQEPISGRSVEENRFRFPTPLSCAIMAEERIIKA